MKTDRRTFLQSTTAPADLNRVEIKSVEPFVVEGACFVKVTASNGVAGWGEAVADYAPLMGFFINNGLKQEVIGESVWDSERNWDRMFYKNHDQGPGGALANAIAGVDIALWDLKGRLLGLPVYQLLGGMYRDRIRVYGGFGVSFGRSMTAPQAAEQAAKFVNQGFTAVKLRMQIRQNRQDPSPDPTLEYARAVRKAIGPDVDFWVDINNGYSAARAIEMLVNQTARVDVSMQPGQLSESVEAQDTAVILSTDSSSVGQVIDSRQMVNLPLKGRGFYDLALLSGAVAPRMPSSFVASRRPTPGGLNAPAFSVAGAREKSNGYLIDGVDAQDPHYLTPSFVPSVDAIQEFKLETNAYSAEFGRYAAQVNATTRSGGNAFHGSLFEFLRNDAFDAANFFDNFSGRGAGGRRS